MSFRSAEKFTTYWRGQRVRMPAYRRRQKMNRISQFMELATLPGSCREMHGKSKPDLTPDARRTVAAGRFKRRDASGADAVCRR